jgi:hypothetical protein
VSSYGLVASSEELSRRQSDVAWLRRAFVRLADSRENGAAHNDIPVAVSENAAVTATFLRLLRSAPLDVVFDQPLAERLETQLREMLSVLADEPRLAHMCLEAMLTPERAVSATRRHIGSEVNRRIRAALGSGAWPEFVEVFELGFYGAVLQANYGAIPPDESVDRLADLIDVVFSSKA